MWFALIYLSLSIYLCTSARTGKNLNIRELYMIFAVCVWVGSNRWIIHVCVVAFSVCGWMLTPLIASFLSGPDMSLTCMWHLVLIMESDLDILYLIRSLPKPSQPIVEGG